MPREIRTDDGKVEFERNYGLYPLGVIKPIGSVNDGTKLNVDFQAKVKSDKHPDAGISMNVQLAKQAKWSHDIPSDKRKELSSEEKRIQNLTRALKNGNTKDANILYLTDITDTLIEKSAKTNLQLGSNLVSRNEDGKNHAVNRIKKKNNYIRLCRRSIDGSSENLITDQKLQDKDCIKFPRSDFYLEHETNNTNRKKNTTRLVGFKIETKTNNGNDNEDFESDKYKQQNELTEASIPDDLINYEEVKSKVGKLGISLNIKKSVIDGKIGKSR